MNCSEFKNKLDDFVDGCLSGGDHLEWERHLLRCSDCREEVDQLRSLIGDAARLPAEVAPARDLWPGIAARMKKRRSSPILATGFSWLSGGRLAAAAAFLVLLTVLVTTAVLRNRQETSVADRSPGGGDAFPTATRVLADFWTAEKEFLRATEQLLMVMEQRKFELSPKMIVVVEENLQILNRAIVRAKSALERDSGNRELGQILTAMYRKKMDFLQKATRLPAYI